MVVAEVDAIGWSSVELAMIRTIGMQMTAELEIMVVGVQQT